MTELADLSFEACEQRLIVMALRQAKLEGGLQLDQTKPQRPAYGTAWWCTKLCVDEIGRLLAKMGEAGWTMD